MKDRLEKYGHPLTYLIGRNLRKRLLKEQNGLCHYCGRLMVMESGTPLSVTADHMVPLSRGGEHIKRNLVGACSDCNQAKGDLLYGFFLTLRMQQRMDSQTEEETNRKIRQIRQRWKSQEALERSNSGKDSTAILIREGGL